MADTRTIEVWESQFDNAALSADHYNFQIAKSVITAVGAKPVFNMVWRSEGLAPDTTIQWDVKYGLNWTKVLPKVGATVVIGGKWAACNKGQILDIDANGYFQASSSPAVPDFLAIGNNAFTPQGGGGIYVIVGLQDESGSFKPVYYEPTTLYTGGGGQWQPQEIVSWWYDTGLRNGSVISSVKSGASGVDFTAPAPPTGEYYYSTTFTTKDSSWHVSPYPPPQSLYAPVPETIIYDPDQLGGGSFEPDAPLIVWWPAIATIAFGFAVKKAVQANFVLAIKADFEKQYKGVTVSFKGDATVTVGIQGPKDASEHSFEAIGTPVDELKADTNAILTKEKPKYLDPSETWQITVTAGSLADIEYLPIRKVKKGAYHNGF